jgi:HNH endonuclease
MVFTYPSTFISKYAPWGYTRYASYKDWLRDEFAFRCVYCLTREKWYPTGHRAFAVEHIVPKASNKGLKTVYENLAYSCHLCNSRKGTQLTLNPRTNPFGTHLVVKPDGTISDLTSNGAKMILLLGLDEHELNEWRKHFIEIYDAFQDPANKGHDFVMSQYEFAFSYPTAVPDLKGKKPRGTNNKHSVNKCCYQQLRGKTKPTVYFM